MNNLEKLAEKYYDLAIDSLQKWIQIDSTFDESTVTELVPFGEGVHKALEYIASLAEKDGFNVDRCDGYCTEISYGEGPLIAIYAHCDVVPVSGKWKFPPFSATIEDDIMYGRGTSDDKGPAIASYYALKLLRDNNLINGYKVTLVIGGNEECGSRCLEHYFHSLHKPYPSYGFTPDGDFPLIYGEKAIATYKVDLNVDIKEISSLNGGVVINSVIDECHAKFNVKLDENKIKEYCLKNNLKYEYHDDELVFYGKSSHGSLPQEGINAGLHMIKFIGLMFNYDQLVKTGDGYMDGSGKKLGVYYESKLLHSTTYNVGLISYNNGVLEYSVNFRYPENVNAEEVCKKLDTLSLGKVHYLGTGDYLLVDPESQMIKTLMNCYQEYTHDYKSQPMAIGGGTYAKESKNTIAFGSHFPGREDHIHEANEKIHLEDLRKSISIYASAIDELGKLTK